MDGMKETDKIDEKETKQVAGLMSGLWSARLICRVKRVKSQKSQNKVKRPKDKTHKKLVSCLCPK